MDKSGADLLFQLVSQRYERGSIIVTTNKAYKHWPSIFNNDAGTTAAILDRLLHRSETMLIEGRSYRMKDRLASPPSPPPELPPAVSGAPRSVAGSLRPMSKSHPTGFGRCLHRDKGSGN